MAKHLLLISAFLVFLVFVNSSKLNVARVLLPVFDDFPTNFTIQATDSGCYLWSTTREDIIRLNPPDDTPALQPGCSSCINVMTVTKDKNRAIADVLAQDPNTNQFMRCVVIVDAIESLAITTTTKELILEEAPELFEVRAYDNQGNEFSTLAGIELDWIVKPMGPNKNSPVMRFIPFKDSSYETPVTLKDLEDRDKRGHKVLLEGIKTGISKISVKLPHKDYDKVKSNELQLTVVANLHIVPTEAYIMVGDVIDFKIIHSSYGKSEEVQLSKSQYYLDVEDKGIAQSQKYDSTVNGIREGITRIVLHDKNIDKDEPGLKNPSATLHVVQPAYMTLNLLPHRNWAALLSEQHEIVVEVFSSDDRKISLGPGVSVQSQIGEAFHVQERSTNGTWQTGWTQSEGTAAVSAVLESVNNKIVGKVTFDPPITATAEITIYPRIILNPSEIILPWDDNARPKYDLDIKATGGDGKFIWSSSNHSIGVVTQGGRVHTFAPGFFEVSAAMHKNHNNRQTAKFHILPPTRLEIVEFVMEAEIGSIIYLHVALYAEKVLNSGDSPSHIPFTSCQDLPFKVKVTDPKFIHKKDSNSLPVGISCGSIAIYSDEIGSSKVTVSYHGDGSRLLQDSVSVSYFKPLQLLQPRGPIIVAVGTATNLIFVGGPKFQIGNAQTKKVKSSLADILQVIDTTQKHELPGDEEYTVVNVICNKLGKTEVILSITNAPNIPNCKNQEGSISVPVICGKPRRFELQPEIKVADAKSCPMDLSADRVVVQSNNDVDLIVRVFDDQGREFIAFNSLKFDWNLENKGMATLGSSDGVFEKNSSFGSASFANKSYQKVTPKVETGQVTIKARLTGYRNEITSGNKVVPEWPEFLDEDEKQYDLPPITATITLYLVDDTIVTPNSISIYNHPGNKHLLDVKQGSGFYEIALSSDTIADVKYLERTRQLEINPLIDGTLTIKLIDLCLLSKPANILISVVSVHILRVEMSDKVEVGKCISAIVRMYDEFDNLLTIPNLEMVEISYKFESGIAKIEKQEMDLKSPWNPGEVHYVITGDEIGETKLIFSIGEPDYEGYVTSAPMELQVFPPLKLYPRNATVTVGSFIQYSTKGGPQPVPNLEYTIVNSATAKISDSGILKGESMGKTTLKARALGTNPTTGHRIVYAEDTVLVTVVKLSSIKIKAPLTRLQIGSTAPIWASAVPEEISPLILASIEPPIQFDWGVADSEVVKISSPLKSTGIEYENIDMLSARLTATSSGKTTVFLNVTMTTANNKSVMYKSSIKIEVFDRLALIKPPGSTTVPLLLAPHSKIQLVTTMDNWGQLTYRLLGDISNTNTEVLKRSSAAPSQPVTISNTGLLESYDSTGFATVLVSAIDTCGLRQTLTVPIEVKPIHYMLLNINTKWSVDSKTPTTVVPAGTEFELRASFFDNVGHEFTAGGVELQVRLSRADLVRIKHGNDNASFFIYTKKPGITALKVWSDSVEKTADYFKLHVEQVIAPMIDHVTVGDVMCFASPVRINEESGSWTATDTSVITIDELTGVGVAVGFRGGQASVYNTLHPSSPMQIRVNPIKDISVDDCKQVLTNAPGILHKTHMLLTSENSKRSTNMFIGWNCANVVERLVSIEAPVKCKIVFENPLIKENPSSVFETRAKFDAAEGKYYCEIAAAPNSNQKFNTLKSDVILTITAYDIQATEVKLKFIPAIYVATELHLDESSYSGVLVINGLCEVLEGTEVRAMDVSILYVSNRRTELNKLSYTIQLLDYHKKLQDMPEFMSLMVTSKITNQVINVLIKVGNVENFNRECGVIPHTSLLAFLHRHRQLLALVIAIVVMLVASAYLYYMYGGTAYVNVNVCQSPNNSVYGTPTTPRMAALNYIQSARNTASGICNPTPLDQTCYCTKSPEIRRNRRYM